jgi:hypothetical protein
MNSIGTVLSSVALLGILVCHILVLVKMIQGGQTVLAVVFLVLTFCCGIAFLIVFIYGWIRVKELGLQNTMVAWTVCVILGLIGSALNPGQFQFVLQQFNLNR